MAGERIVAVFAGVIDTTTFHFDGNDIDRCMVVNAPALRVYVDAAYFETAHKRSG